MQKKPTIDELKQKDLERIEAYKTVFKSQAGQLVLQDLKRTFYDDDLLDRTSPHNTSYNLGLRDGVRFILETLEETPDA